MVITKRFVRVLTVVAAIAGLAAALVYFVPTARAVPCDGSTNIPKSNVGALQGVTANAYGLCPAETEVGTYCKLSYATGAYYSGERWCQPYYGYSRCVLK